MRQAFSRHHDFVAKRFAELCQEVTADIGVEAYEEVSEVLRDLEETYPARALIAAVLGDGPPWDVAMVHSPPGFTEIFSIARDRNLAIRR